MPAQRFLKLAEELVPTILAERGAIEGSRRLPPDLARAYPSQAIRFGHPDLTVRDRGTILPVFHETMQGTQDHYDHPQCFQ
jgi:hypothetical protein